MPALSKLHVATTLLSLCLAAGAVAQDFPLPPGSGAPSLQPAHHKRATVPTSLGEAHAFYVAQFKSVKTVVVGPVLKESPPRFEVVSTHPDDSWAKATVTAIGPQETAVLVVPRFQLECVVVEGARAPWVTVVMTRHQDAAVVAREQDHLQAPPALREKR